jgi:hypothetical protein
MSNLQKSYTIKESPDILPPGSPGNMDVCAVFSSPLYSNTHLFMCMPTSIQMHRYTFFSQRGRTYSWAHSHASQFNSAHATLSKLCIYNSFPSIHRPGSQSFHVVTYLLSPVCVANPHPGPLPPQPPCMCGWSQCFTCIDHPSWTGLIPHWRGVTGRSGGIQCY